MTRMKTLKMMRQKRGQFYILTAIVLIAFSLLTVHSSIQVETDQGTFKIIYTNFKAESAAALNNALAEEKNVNSEYDVFLDSFIAYSKMKKTRVEIVSVLVTGDRAYLSNKMQEDVGILNLNTTIPAGGSASYPRSNFTEAVLEVRDDVFHENIYKLNLSVQGTEAKAILKLKKGSNREIFVQE